MTEQLGHKNWVNQNPDCSYNGDRSYYYKCIPVQAHIILIKSLLFLITFILIKSYKACQNQTLLWRNTEHQVDTLSIFTDS